MRNLLRKIFLFLSLACAGLLSAVYARIPVRVISLSPSITYTIRQIGAEDLVVGRTSYCPPPESGTASIVGNVLEVQLEKIIALKPDVVFCMSFTKEKTIRTLENMGIKVINFRTPKSFDEICQQTSRIGETIGYGQEAAELVRSEKKKVDSICRIFSATPPTRPFRTFFQIGSSPVFPVIEDSYMNQYLTLLGLDNIVKDYKGGGISKEYVIAARPELMIISKMSGLGEQVMQEWMQFKQIPAIASHRIFLIDDNYACCPTPLFFRITLQTIASYLQNGHE